ncbi:MAG: fumarylacetoacetate hydrolase family protein [Deferribacterota bacterium]|nr:fumarylacetoacetate hydrolase family protein [Deferribacterota bacterium]
MKILYFENLKTTKRHYGFLRDTHVHIIEGNIFEKFNITDETITLDNIKILPPTNPSKIIGVGLNYVDHAKEVKMKIPKEPILFLKPNSSVIGQNDNIVLPNQSNKVEYEAELAVIIKKKAKQIEISRAKEYILGYTCANDVTARDLQQSDSQWTRAKSFDTFCPIGPFIETALDPTNLDIKLFLNKKLRQDSNTNLMIFGIYKLISYISHIMTLYPGDAILTGTPPGVGPINKGDEIIVSIQGIGELRNFVI